MADFEVELDIENFGPHTNLNFIDKTNSIKMGIFANNGIGKTFISRAFRLVSLINSSTSFEDLETNNILTTNQQRGKFKYKIINPDGTVKTLQIELKKDADPIITDNTGYFFHVFNSDYVKDNLELNDYNPPGDNIQGYILGKSFIDVTKEKLKLQTIESKLEKIHLKIKDATENALSDLDTLKIRKSTKEYKMITFENLIKGVNISEDESYESLIEDHTQLKSLPTNMDDVPLLEYNIIKTPVKDIQTLLSTHYAKSKLGKEFVDKIKSKQLFIEDGIELYDTQKNVCPFCHQDLEKKALNLIKLYEEYITDSEAKTSKKIDLTIKKLKELKSNIQNQYNEYNKITLLYNDAKKYFPSLKKDVLTPLVDNTSILWNIDELIKMLSLKKQDIESTDFQFEESIKEIESFLKELKTILNNQNSKINSLNKIKKSTNNEILELNRKLCKARYLNLSNEEESNIKKFNELSLEISDLKKEIIKKENKSKIDKKRKVVETLQYFLNFFFNGKYKFDKNKFCITFMDEKLSNNATHVLSDGEKGIVAFCYYLATVHNIIEKEDDYKNLFFIIDDPISSMDFTFVHKVSQCISEINHHFDPDSFNKFIILTHNLEFMNLLMSNRLIGQKYILKKNEIYKWNKQLMLPYENHLSDIIKISAEELPPSHTTPNSIRHVLETICKFENREKKLIVFMQENEILRENAYIYTLMQDLSHGRLRSQTLDDSELINACTVVKKYIKTKYPGQIEGL